MKRPFFFVLLISMFLVSCGQNVDESYSKEYVLAVENADSETNSQFFQLVAEFNEKTGSDVLRFTNNPAEANSMITMVEGLQATDGKVGWGQWVSTTTEDQKVDGLKLNVDREVAYSMRLQFDLNYFKTRMGENMTEEKHYGLQKLFFHEVGHGLQMDHHPDQSNVMYYEISGKKDFDLYFEDVRNFFGL